VRARGVLARTGTLSFSRRKLVGNTEDGSAASAFMHLPTGLTSWHPPAPVPADGSLQTPRSAQAELEELATFQAELGRLMTGKAEPQVLAMPQPAATAKADASASDEAEERAFAPQAFITWSSFAKLARIRDIGSPTSLLARPAIRVPTHIGGEAGPPLPPLRALPRAPAAGERPSSASRTQPRRAGVLGSLRPQSAAVAPETGPGPQPQPQRGRALSRPGPWSTADEEDSDTIPLTGRTRQG
jgi:hypothetical protein